MSGPTSWPGKNNSITSINYALMTGFDSHGQPVYSRGTVDSPEERAKVQSILEPLRPGPGHIASVTMGEVVIGLEDGQTLTLRPVFHPSLDTYRDLFMVDEWQYPLPPSFAKLLARWRNESE